MTARRPIALCHCCFNCLEVEDEKERLRCIFSMIDLLPKVNRAVLDRLMYHLSRYVLRMYLNGYKVLFSDEAYIWYCYIV